MAITYNALASCRCTEPILSRAMTSAWECRGNICPMIQLAGCMFDMVQGNTLERPLFCESGKIFCCSLHPESQTKDGTGGNCSVICGFWGKQGIIVKSSLLQCTALNNNMCRWTAEGFPGHKESPSPSVPVSTRSTFRKCEFQCPSAVEC